MRLWFFFTRILWSFYPLFLSPLLNKQAYDFPQVSEEVMRVRLLVNLMIILAISTAWLSGCTSFYYLRHDMLKEPCIRAAKIKMTNESAACQLLSEVSLREYEQAIAEADAWIEANRLTDAEIQKLQQGDVWVGMLAAAAELAWGPPQRVEKAANTQGEEQWFYEGSRRLTVQKDKVFAIQME